MNISEMS